MATRNQDCEQIAQRRRCMRALAHAPAEDLAAAWDTWQPKPEVEEIRGPQAGLVMVRGRIGGGGDPFNLGEATVSRATVRLHGDAMTGEQIGTGYVLGTELRHAWLAAVFDGLLADDRQRLRVLDTVVDPLTRAQAEHDDLRRGEAAGTKVDFFTVAREHR
nr:phosphonate C-P lyase system protein PhnG [Pseudonocardia sp. HH130630-07]